MLKDRVVHHDDDADEDPQLEDELPLRGQVGLAGRVDELGNVPHDLVNRQVLELLVDHQAEHQADEANEQADGEQRGPGHAEELHRGQVWQDEIALRRQR